MSETSTETEIPGIEFFRRPEDQTALPPAVRRRRRWWQMRPTLLLAGLGAIIFSGIWLTKQGLHGYAQSKSIEAVRQLDGNIAFDYQLQRNREAPGPQWLRAVIGAEYFANVEVVELHGTAVTDEDLGQLDGFPYAKFLHIEGTQVTNKGLRNLSFMPHLVWVFAKDSNVTAEGVADLKASVPQAQIRFR